MRQRNKHFKVIFYHDVNKRDERKTLDVYTYVILVDFFSFKKQILSSQLILALLVADTNDCLNHFIHYIQLLSHFIEFNIFFNSSLTLGKTGINIS